MKISLIILLLSLSAFAQKRFLIPEGSENVRSLKICKQNHLIIIRTYRAQIDSEITRLVAGIEYESKDKIQIPLLQNYLVDLLVKRIFITELETQLKQVDLDQERQKNPPRKIFNTDTIQVNLEKQIGVHLDEVMARESFGDYAVKEFKTQLTKSLLKEIAQGTYKAIGNGLLTKIIATGVSSAAFKSALMNIGSEAFASAGTATILTLLTIPLTSYRLPPETVWTNILHKNPEMILNPEWMKFAGSYDDPWMSHSWALIRRTDQMESAYNTLLKKEEADFLRTVMRIGKISEASVKQPEIRDPFRNQPDGTYVYHNSQVITHPPFWALRRK